MRVALDLDVLVNNAADAYLWDNYLPQQRPEVNVFALYTATKKTLSGTRWRDVNYWFARLHAGSPKKALVDYHDLASLNDAMLEYVLHALKEADLKLELYTKADPLLLRIWQEKFPNTFKLFDKIQRSDKYQSDADIILDREEGKERAIVLPRNYHSAEIIEKLFPGRCVLPSPNVNGLSMENPRVVPDLSNADYPFYVLFDNKNQAKFIKVEHTDLEGKPTGHGYYKQIFYDGTVHLFVRIPIAKEAIKKAYAMVKQPKNKAYRQLNEFVAELIAKYAPSSARVLDLGGGTGLLAEALNKKGFYDITIVDIAPHDTNKTTAKIIKKDMFSFHKRRKYDVISLINVWHDYIDADLDTLGNIIDNHLKEEGIVISVSPQIDPHSVMKKRFVVKEEDLYWFGKDSLNYVVMKKEKKKEEL